MKKQLIKVNCQPSLEYVFRIIPINILSYLLVILMFMSCINSQKSEDTKIDDKSKTDLNYKFVIDKANIILMYKLQKQIVSSTNDSVLLRKMVIDSIYIPNQRLFSYCLGYEKEIFADKYTNAMLVKSDTIIKLAVAYEAAKIDEVIINTMKTISEKSQYPLEGKFVIGFFEDAGCIMCGCDNGTMLGNTYNTSFNKPATIKVVLAHEINHNLFETAKSEDPDNNTVLYNSIDEGFANMFSMKVMNVNKLKAFNMSADEYNWLERNENELKEKFKRIMFSDKEEDWDAYSAKIPDSILQGSPGDVGYFIGYRIIEEWLKKDENRNWQDIYSTPVRQILAESGYFE